MSALGHKRTCAAHSLMSALGQKQTLGSRIWRLRLHDLDGSLRATDVDATAERSFLKPTDAASIAEGVDALDHGGRCSVPSNVADSIRCRRKSLARSPSC